MAKFKKARNAGLGAALAAAIVCFGATGALAQAASPAPAAPAAAPAPAAPTTAAATPAAGGACFQAPAALSPDEVASFLANPPALLATYPTGGLPLATRARALAGTSMNAVDALIALAVNASGDQRSAIGAGLARAARACVAANPQYASLIQQKVAASNMADVVTAFLAASNDVQTAALGGAGAGGGAASAGGIGAGGTTNGGAGTAAGDAGTATSAEPFSVSRTGTGRTVQNFTTNFSTNIVQQPSVSPSS